jgi:hypothetical protein
MRWIHPPNMQAALALAFLFALLLAPMGSARAWDGKLYFALISSATMGNSYYVDCTGGNDSNGGASPQQAWRSLWKANRAPLAPGDQLLLKRGCVWNGPLNASWKGGDGKPITVGSYGSGEYPIIQNSQYAVVISGINLIVQNIHARGAAASADPNCQNQGKGWQIGFRFEPGASYTTLRYARASGLTHGVKITRGAHHNRVLNSSFRDNTQMFILDGSNTNNDAGANGIVIEGDDNEVAYNEFVGHDACSFDYGRDGSAIEIFGAQRNRVHHNRAHNNNTFVELGDKRSADNTFAYNQVTSSTARANFLVTEGASGGRGPVMRTKAYNNSVYLSDPTSIAINCDGGCKPDILALRSNVIWSEGRIGYTDEPCDEANNLFWRSDGKPQIFFPTPAQRSPSSRIANPLWRDPATGDLRLREGSPAIDTGGGEAVGLGYKSDLDGTPVPSRSKADVGAYELR